MKEIIDVVFRFKHGYLWYVHGAVDVVLAISLIYFIIEAVK